MGKADPEHDKIVGQAAPVAPAPVMRRRREAGKPPGERPLINKLRQAMPVPNRQIKLACRHPVGAGRIIAGDRTLAHHPAGDRQRPAMLQNQPVTDNSRIARRMTFMADSGTRWTVISIRRS